VDWFIPAQAAQLSRTERWRLRLAVGTALLLSVLISLTLPVTLPRAGLVPPTISALVTAPLFFFAALTPRLFGTLRLPGLVLSLYPLLSTLVVALKDPLVTDYCLVMPLLAGLFAGPRVVLLAAVIGVAELLWLGGPLAGALPMRELGVRINHIFETVMVAGVTLLSDRFLLETERERQEARDHAVRLGRDQMQQEETQRAQGRLLLYQSLRAEVSQALAGQAPLAEGLQRCCESMVRHLGAALARIWLLNEAGDTLELQASAGLYTHTNGAHGTVPMGRRRVGRIAEERKPHVTNDVQNDPQLLDRAWAEREGLKAFAGYPLIVGERLIGVMALFSTRALEEDSLEVLSATAESVAQGAERRRAELGLAERAEQLARSNRDLEQFAYVASHDLQEPLRMVASYAQLLSRRYKGRLDSDADEFIGFVVDGVARMKRLIQALLDYSRVGTRRQEPAPVDLGQVLSQTLGVLSGAIDDAGAEVTCDALPVVMGDEVQFGQLFQNLLSNALKFRRPDVKPRIRVTVTESGNEWIFSVEDNGIGIEPSQFERIFVVFQRLHTQAEYPGTGIGLAVCKRIVEGHGGWIRVESQPGAGTTFRFALPSEAGPTQLTPRGDLSVLSRAS